MTYLWWLWWLWRLWQLREFNHDFFLKLLSNSFNFHRKLFRPSTGLAFKHSFWSFCSGNCCWNCFKHRRRIFKIRMSYVLHCQSSSLKRPLLFSASCFPIAVPPAFIVVRLFAKESKNITGFNFKTFSCDLNRDYKINDLNQWLQSKNLGYSYDFIAVTSITVIIYSPAPHRLHWCLREKFTFPHLKKII